MWQPGGFRRPVPAAHREWKTPNGRANFIAPATLDEDPDQPPIDGDVLRLFTIRSDSQFNTTVYNEDDRFRGIYGGRKVLLVNLADLARLDLAEGDMVDVHGVTDDGVVRVVPGLKLVGYDVPPGCIAGYYPECNPLLPLEHHALESMVPSAKAISVRLVAAAG